MEKTLMKIKYQLALEDTPEMIERDGFGPPEEWATLGPPTRIRVRGLPPGQEAAICRSSAVNPSPDACPYSIQRKIGEALWSDWGGMYTTAAVALTALQFGIDNVQSVGQNAVGSRRPS